MKTTDTNADPNGILKILGPQLTRVRQPTQKSKRTQSFWFEGEKLDDYVDALNYLYPADEWAPKRAKKDHVDLFGDKIADREWYFHRNVGEAWNDVVRLSRRSMDRLLFALHGHRNWVLREAIGELRKKAVAENKQRWQRSCPPLPFWTQAEAGNGDDS